MAGKNKNASPKDDEMELDLMTLEDGDGNEVTFEVIDTLDYNEVHYLAVVEYVEDEDQVDENSQLILLKVGEDEEGEFLDIVEDDEELLAVSKLVEKRLEGQFEIKN